jgi:hypothetical protein
MRRLYLDLRYQANAKQGITDQTALDRSLPATSTCSFGKKGIDKGDALLYSLEQERLQLKIGAGHLRECPASEKYNLSSGLTSNS